MKPMYFLKSAVASSMVLAAIGVHAQMTSCNVFLKGQYVEVGISPGASYGSSEGAPSGYHANCGGGGSSYGCSSSGGSGLNPLGFIADPAMDGWGVGSPAFFGDYFLPGYPYEGWEIQIGTNYGDAFNTGGFGGVGGGGLTGSNVSFTTSGPVVTGTWQGMFDSVRIKQETSLDTNALYFSVRVTLTNTSAFAKSNIYYSRSVDPDNDVMQPGGSFTTANKIEYQLPNTLNATVVSAKGTTFPSAYLALGTTDTNANCFICDGGLSPTTTLPDIWSRTGTAAGYTYAMGATYTSDVGIGLVFRIPHLASADSAVDSVSRTTTASTRHPANTASFTYFYSFSPAATDTALKYDTVAVVIPPSIATGIQNVNAGPEVKVFPNPAKNTISVTGLNLNDQLMLFDMMGRPTELARNVNSTGINTYSISSMPQGNYILQVKDANGNLRSRVRVQKQ